LFLLLVRTNHNERTKRIFKALQLQQFTSHRCSNPCNSCRKWKATGPRLCLQTYWYTNSMLDVPRESWERSIKSVLRIPNETVISPPQPPRPTQIPMIITWLFVRNF
jgi:hypothetical protein